MKALIVTLSTLFVIVKDSIAQDDGNGLYSRRYERLDIDTILASPRLVTNYVDCLLSKKPCPPEGKALKRILPEALRTKCGRCWPSQKEGALKVITALYYDYPQHYQALRERWDPTGEYNRRFEEYLHDQRFNVINSNAGQDGIEQGDTSQVLRRPTKKRIIPTITKTTVQSATFNPVNNPPPSEEQLGEASGTVANRFGSPDQENKIPQNQNPVIISSTTTYRPPITRTNKPITLGTRSPTTKRIQRIPQTVATPLNTPPPLPGFVTHTTLQTNNPILKVINHLTLKVANTAELLAGMLNGATSQDS
ncbi:uncharacterized protein LOC129610747 isoform X2 [Condylostylus longicornis]|uniref:uncharacterized protein LOC129610747 isoform X2 n=1 Tax=Condylostylus longicornis TaxID=2530218 RepID=UPI00244D9A30|nr:uncharacterized protein LOC129610747 isoform X2 [Condylostylus longicornis]